MNFLKGLVGAAATITLTLDGAEDRPHHQPGLRKKSESLSSATAGGAGAEQDGGSKKGAEDTNSFPVYFDNETLSGKVSVTVPGGQGKTLMHQGIKAILQGVIKSSSGSAHEFLSVEKELEPTGTNTGTKDYTFSFEGAERKYESYRGVNIQLSYFVRIVIARNMAPDVTKQQEIWVQNYQAPPEHNQHIRMEVGIEDCLHIEFEYNKSKYHLKDVIIGKIFFLLVRLKIKSMNISLIRRETTGSGLDMYNENRTLSKYEIMDGCPVKGEAIPVRLFLGGFDLTPSYKDVANKFSVSYILNLVLVDEDDRRYFKQREVILWRRAPQEKEDEFAITSVEGRTEMPAEYKKRIAAEKAAKAERKAKRDQRRKEKAAQRAAQTAAPTETAPEEEE